MNKELEQIKELIHYQKEVIEYQKALLDMKDKMIQTHICTIARLMSEKDQLRKELYSVKVELSDLKAGL